MINKPPIKKRYYKIGVGYYDVWTSDREIALKIFNLLSEGNAFLPGDFNSSHNYDEKFYYKKHKQEISMKSLEAEIYENQIDAEDSKRRYDKAYKMRLITKKKKKKIP